MFRVFTIERRVNAVDDVPGKLEVVVIKDRRSWVAVHAEPQQPLADSAIYVILKFFDFAINLKQLLIVLNDGLGRFWIVVDSPITHEVRQVGVLNLVTDARCILKVELELGDEEDLERRGLDGLGHIDNLLQARHTERNIHRRDTSTMESVQGHLSGGLAHGLSTDATHHLTGMDYCALEYFLDCADELIERSLVEALLTDDLFGAEVAAKENLEQPR